MPKLRGDEEPTPKQAAFVQAYMALNNATEAYDKVYNVKKTMNRTTVGHNADTMLNNERVLRYLAKLKEEKAAKLRAKTAKTVEDFVRDLEEAADLAKQTGNAAALATVRMHQAKLLGLVTDKSEARVTNVVTPAEQAPDLASIWTRVGHGKSGQA